MSGAVCANGFPKVLRAVGDTAVANPNTILLILVSSYHVHRFTVVAVVRDERRSPRRWIPKRVVSGAAGANPNATLPIVLSERLRNGSIYSLDAGHSIESDFASRTFFRELCNCSSSDPNPRFDGH